MNTLEAADWKHVLLERRALIAVLAAFVWDFILSFPEEIRITQLRRFSWPMITHYSSRLITFAFVICGVVLSTLDIKDCNTLGVAIGIFFVIAETTTSLLFLHRIRAIFFGERLIVAFFALLWITVVGTSISVPITTVLSPRIFLFASQSRTEVVYCDMRFKTHYVPLSVVVTAAAFDMFVFMFISWRLVRNMRFARTRSDNGSRTSLCWEYLKTWCGGDNLPALSRTIFRGGRKYYLHTVTLDIFILCVVSEGFTSISSNNIVFALLFIELSLKNIFACRLFRETLLELGIANGTSTTSSSETAAVSQGIEFAAPTTLSGPGGELGDRMDLAFADQSAVPAYSNDIREDSLASSSRTLRVTA
ncbi:hypothetical protein BXZ70DRAFT_1009927 [Cristinia sonorae]|uniref:Uncharacterized protein n=1 Tax=Cristinia sonorae TaxID=1940300 RepID=A0A8K0UJH0_9AGAR|nr:hypothetical protein BXZ70DRAFT_1009927 [Cristinia sonorae]